jgi:hypothetical protein
VLLCALSGVCGTMWCGDRYGLELLLLLLILLLLGLVL